MVPKVWTSSFHERMCTQMLLSELIYRVTTISSDAAFPYRSYHPDNRIDGYMICYRGSVTGFEHRCRAGWRTSDASAIYCYETVIWLVVTAGVAAA